MDLLRDSLLRWNSQCPPGCVVIIQTCGDMAIPLRATDRVTHLATRVSSDVERPVKSSTAFGAKYVDLIVPEEGATHRQLAKGAVLRSRNVTVEVNTVFENLQSIVRAIDPAKLNGVLSALSDAFRGKGDLVP